MISATGYICVGIFLMLYTWMNLQTHSHVTANLKKRWYRWLTISIAIVVAWPLFLAVSFSWYINEKISNW